MISKARVQASPLATPGSKRAGASCSPRPTTSCKSSRSRGAISSRGGDRQARKISSADHRRPCLSEPRASTATSRSPQAGESTVETPINRSIGHITTNAVSINATSRVTPRAASTSIMFTAGLLQPFKMRGHEQGYVTKIEAEGIPYLIQIDATHMSMELLAPFSKIEDEKAPPRQSRRLILSLRGLKSRNCRGPVSQDQNCESSEQAKITGSRNCRSRASWKSKLWERRASAIPQQPWKKVHGG